MPYFEVGLRDLADVAVVAVLVWFGLVFLRQTRARMALIGLSMLGVVYLAARTLGLELTAALLQGFFAVVVLVLVVVFQDDLRRFFEQIATVGLRRRAGMVPNPVQDLLVRCAARLAATRTGALIVLPGREPLDRHIEGGILLRGNVSEPLLLSLFDKHSPGHDGAVIVSGRTVERFAVHLPLSADHAQVGPGGTRHAAALGLAERADALCIVVSEERGTVSVAVEGQLRTLRRPEDLTPELRRFLAEPAAEARGPARRRRLRAVWRDAAVAIGIALGLWVVFVPGSTIGQATFEAPVEVDNMPEGWTIDTVEPGEVAVTLSGPRRSLYLASRGELAVQVDALLVQLGRRTFSIGPDSVRHPEGLSVVQIDPQAVKISVSRTPPNGAASTEGKSP